MSTDFFCNVIDQATAFGHTSFGLTPITGEVFVDRDLLSKLEYMEDHSGVGLYRFYSNYIQTSEDFHDFLSDVKKLHTLTVSIYGHDEESFKKVTGGSQKQYEHLIQNLSGLLDTYQSPDRQYRVNLTVRTEAGFDYDSWDSDIGRLVKTGKSLGTGLSIMTGQYDNWGGLVDKKELEDLNITLKDDIDHTRDKSGPCSIIFYKTIVMADGRINACACRDTDGTLIIGDLNHQRLEEIYSVNNPHYMDLIENQIQNTYDNVCRYCSHHKTIYVPEPVIYPIKRKNKQISLEEFYRHLNR